MNSSLDSGGSERVMSIIANGLAEKKYDVTMALLRDKKRVYYVNDDVNVIQFKYKSSNKLNIFFSRFFQYRELLKKVKPDVIISFMWDINLFTIISSVGYKSKIIVSERAHPCMGTQNLFRKFGQKYLYLLANKVVLQTDYVKKFFSTKVKAKAVVIPNPVEKRKAINYGNKNKKVIVAVGRLTEQKNFQLLIDSFSKFHKSFSDYRLEIYGDGPLKSILQNMISNYGLNDYISLMGYASDIDSKMRQASFYVSSSNFEGISNSMLEALSIGLPCICTDCPVGGASLVIKDNVNGILVPVGDEAKLLHAMIRIASDGIFAKKLSENAKNVQKDFSLEKILDEWIKIL